MGIPNILRIMKYISSLITKLFEILLTKALQTKFKAYALHLIFMHGWLLQIELHGAWFLDVAQHQLVVMLWWLFYSVRKEVNQFTVTYGLLRDPQFTSTHIKFDLEVCYVHTSLCRLYYLYLLAICV